MNAFDDFIRKHSPAEDIRRAAAETLARYRNLIPAALMDFWEQTAWCSFGNGFFWINDPAELEDALTEWLDTGPGLVITRTAFGHLFVWLTGAVFLLNIHTGDLRQITNDVEIFFNTVLCDATVLQGLDKDLYDEAVVRLGKPNPDECFAFVPVLPLGGAHVAGNLQRVKLREHLLLLSQVLRGDLS